VLWILDHLKDLVTPVYRPHKGIDDHQLVPDPQPDAMPSDLRRARIAAWMRMSSGFAATREVVVSKGNVPVVVVVGLLAILSVIAAALV
jgi:hypothetical protein